MYLNEMVMNPSKAWTWAMGWVEEAKNGSHRPVKTIHETAAKIKDQFYTNGLWSPGAEQVYNTLLEAAEMAQSEYENA